MNSYSPVSPFSQGLQARCGPATQAFDHAEWTGPAGTYLPYLTDEPECNPRGLHPYTQNFVSLSDSIVVSPSDCRHQPLSPPGPPSPLRQGPLLQPATPKLWPAELPLLNSRYSPVHQQLSPYQKQQPREQQQAYFPTARQARNAPQDGDHLYARLDQSYVQTSAHPVPLRYSFLVQAPQWPYGKAQEQLPPTATTPASPQPMPRAVNLFSNESVMSRLPTWGELDEMSAQIRELYALRSLLHPQERKARKPIAKRVPRRASTPRMHTGTINSKGSRDSLVVVNSPLYEDYYVRGEDGVYYCPRRASQPAQPAQPAQPTQAARAAQSQRTRSTQPTVLDRETDAPRPSTRPGPNPTHEAEPKCDCFEPRDAAASAATIKSILKELDSRSKAFVYPKHLDFIEPESPSDQPQLEDSPNNAPFIEHRQKLMGLVGRLEDVLIYGDEGVRLARLAAIDRVTDGLSKVGKVKAKLWKKHVRKESRAKSRKAFWRWLTTYEWD